MDNDLTPAKRILWAKEHSRKTWEQLGTEVGCSHSALVQWSKGQVDVLKAKVHLVVAFAAATGVNLQWLLAGEGEPLAGRRYAEHQLVKEARHIVAEMPALAEGAYQLLLAFETATTKH